MSTASVWVLTPAKLKAMCAQLTPEHRLELRKRFVAERAILKQVFPRGRFRMAEDGRCVLMPRSKELQDAYLFLSGAQVGLFWNARRGRLAKALKDFPQPRPAVECEDEGIWYFPFVPGLAKALPWFSKRKVNEAQRQELTGRRPGRHCVPGNVGYVTIGPSDGKLAMQNLTRLPAAAKPTQT